MIWWPIWRGRWVEIKRSEMSLPQDALIHVADLRVTPEQKAVVVLSSVWVISSGEFSERYSSDPEVSPQI